MTEPPLYPECVIGYRAWYAGLDGTLWPAGWVPQRAGMPKVHRPWRPGPNTAACPLGAHTAPDLDCTCGLHATFAPPAPAFGFVTGAVAAWGLVQVHRDGFRAEHAQITALVEPPGRIDVVAIAERYGVPVVPGDLLAFEAARHGRHIVPAAVPAANPPAPADAS